MILPEIGGRIHILQDKTNGYDVIYNQPVIKPCARWLAWPWISGGIGVQLAAASSPATFLPVDFEIENTRTVQKQFGERPRPDVPHEGMHGVCLHPGKNFLELKVRAYNRTRLCKLFCGGRM